MKISNYPEVETLNEDDLLVISRPGEGTKSVSIASLAQLLAAGIGNAVANNLNTTEEGYILDARQGKVLKDLHDSRIKVLYDGPASNGSVATLSDSIANYTLIFVGPRWYTSGQIVDASFNTVEKFRLGNNNSPQGDFFDGSTRHFLRCDYRTDTTVSFLLNTTSYNACLIVGIK